MLEPKKIGRPSKKPTIEELDYLYSKKTAKEVATLYGVTEQTIRRWIREYRKENEDIAKKD